MHRSFCVTFLATNMQEGWDIIHLKGEVHSSVWSTKTFLYDIRKLRYKQIKMGYQITKVLDIGQSCSLKSDVQYCLTYISAALRFTKTFLYDIREPRYKQIKRGYPITKVLDIGQSSSLNSDVQYCLTYISAALRFTEIVLSF